MEVREERQRVNEFRRAPLFLLETLRQIGHVTLSHEPRAVSQNLVDGGKIADFLWRAMKAFQPSGIPAQLQKVPGKRLGEWRTAHARNGHHADVGAVGEGQGAVARQQMQVAFEENLAVFGMKV